MERWVTTKEPRCPRFPWFAVGMCGMIIFKPAEKGHVALFLAQVACFVFLVWFGVIWCGLVGRFGWFGVVW